MMSGGNCFAETSEIWAATGMLTPTGSSGIRTLWNCCSGIPSCWIPIKRTSSPTTTERQSVRVAGGGVPRYLHHYLFLVEADRLITAYRRLSPTKFGHDISRSSLVV